VVIRAAREDDSGGGGSRMRVSWAGRHTTGVRLHTDWGTRVRLETVRKEKGQLDVSSMSCLLSRPVAQFSLLVPYVVILV